MAVNINIVGINELDFPAGALSASTVNGKTTINLAVCPQTKGATASNWLRSYDATTGLFTVSQPAYLDISGNPIDAGIPVLTASVNSTGLTAAVGPTTLYAVPVSGAGLYRICFYAKITTAGSVSSVLGGTSGFQVTWTDPTDSTTPTAAVNDALGTVLNGNTTTTVAAGAVVIAAKASTNIQYAYDYTSSLANTMAYKLSIKIEFLG